jgi:hypothetical protein
MRTFAESCALLDKIVGRCVRDAAFADAVLDDPVVALAEYHLDPEELADFVALQKGHRAEAAAGWAAIRSGMELIRAERSGRPVRLTVGPEPE